MTKKLSELDLALMERRFRKSEQDSAIRDYRRKKGSSAVSQGSRWAQKTVADVRAGEAAASRAHVKTEATKPATTTRTPHVVMKAPLDDSAIPFKSMSIVMEVGATIGNKVALDQRDEVLAGENVPSLLISISRLGSEDFRVYPDFQSAKDAADKDNEAIDNYIKHVAKDNA